ncbi:MAG TPA: alpha/beta hydrolase [Kofleriaceae bacterium]|nr:alpha/beta hydrolase [Kofleriaceae bacterium]
MPARLHHERIAHAGAAPRKWLALTHGIYGAGSNWRSIARKVTDARPEWGIVLVDLRQHGKSENGAPPHTIAACADDLAALFAELGGVTAVAGHSFGGKVALATRRILDLEQTWILDSSPSARAKTLAGLDDPRDGTVIRVLDFMARAPRTWPTREDFVRAVVGEGHDEGLARWLAMSLLPDPAGGVALRFDVAALREMLRDYQAVDLWDVLEAPGHDVEVVIAAQSSTVNAADRGRLAAAPPHVHVHYVEAGHWLHIDAPARVIELVSARLP